MRRFYRRTVRPAYSFGKAVMMRRGQDLDKLLGYQLQIANLRMARDARDALAGCGLTPAKVTALVLIRDNPGCGQTTLGRAMSVNRSSAMKLVNMLVERGLIERRPGPDLRTNALHLLAEGEERLRELLHRLSESDRRMTERLNPAEVATLSKLLARLGPARRGSARTAD